jgi:hypothetical protein
VGMKRGHLCLPLRHHGPHRGCVVTRLLQHLVLL